MKAMSKPVVFAALLAAAILAAGMFGALHNQLSYSVGPSYFHDFKFTQFGIDPDWQNRLGAALVGWRASWWMGLLIGLPAFGLGFVMISRPQTYLGAGLGAIGSVLTLTLLAAMLGLLLGMGGPGAPFAQTIAVPQDIPDRDGFLRAAFMHEASYLGGALGLAIALWTMWRVSRAERAALQSPAPGARP